MHVKDGEVVAATGNVERLKAAANNVGGGGTKALNEIESGARRVDGATAAAAQRLGITYDQMIAKIKAAASASQASSAVISAADKKRISEAHSRGIAAEKAAKAEQELAQASEEAAGGIAQILSKAGPAGIALAGLTLIIVGTIAVAVKLGKEFFELVQGFAKYASDIGKAAEETGLMTRTVAGLTAEAERQGRSFDQLKGPIDNFRKVIGQAAAGSDEARARLNLLGVDAGNAARNIDAAFRLAVTKIVEAKDPIEQARLAYAAFGEEGYKLIPFFQSFNGNVNEAIRRAEELGIVIGDKDVKAAKDFNRAYADAEKAVQGLKNQIGKDFLPVVVDALQQFTGWVARNKNEILSWATAAGNGVVRLLDAFVSIVKFIEDHPTAFGLIESFIKYAALGQIAQVQTASPGPITGLGNRPDLPPQIDYSRPKSGAFDPAAAEAMRAAQEKLRQEREKAEKADLAAQIRIFENQIRGVEKIYDEHFKKLTEKFKETGDVQQYEDAFAALREWYGGLVNDMGSDWSKLVEKQTLAEKQGQNERFLVYQETQDRLQALGQKTLDFEDAKNKAITDQQKKASAEQLKNLEATMQRAIELSDEKAKTDIATARQSYDLQIFSERKLVDQINKIELDALNFRRNELQKHLAAVIGHKDKEADVRQKIGVLDQQITQQQITNAGRVLEVERKKQEAVDELRKQYEDYRQSLEDEIVTLSRGGRQLTRYEQTLRDMERSYKDLTVAQKEELLVLAQQADALDELNRRHAELKDFFATNLRYVFEGDFEGLFENLRRNVIDRFTDKISDWFATTILGFDPDENAPIVGPVVDKINDTNQILKAILARLGGSPLSSIGGGGLGGILGGLGIGGLGGAGIGGTPPFNPGFFGGGSGTGSVSILANGQPAYNVNGSQGGGFLSNIRNLFSTNQGGIFAPRERVGGGTSRMGGILGGIGDIAAVAGGLIGGRFGNVLSMAGTGASIGAMFGPWGAVIGAGAGALFGLLMGDPKRKQDKKENIPALHKGFADAMAELNKILAGVRQLSLDPDEAISRAGEVRAEIAGGFGIQFLSSKYRKEAQKLIKAKLAEIDRQPDGLMAQILEAAGIARGAADRRQRILPEFAGGHYFADFFRPNGLVPGAFDGADNILAMISRGEMVLNPRQQNRVRALAGYDVFAGAGIPNYPKASSSPQLATGGIAGAGLNVQMPAPQIMLPNLTLYLQGVAWKDDARGYLQSDDGRRVLVQVIKEERKFDKNL
jgi:hypothetical protein